jgi:diaminohydroxyphosphoribosylaminopyrimidine deaminase/5-amino-6-(5-phosphoribosylamino)uracil reductase
MRDPFPLVDGRGIRRLEREGVDVAVGLLEEDATRLNEAWLHRLREKRPLVTLKLAQTLDGKIATRTGDSRWVSGKEARALVHRMRDRSDAILVGRRTIELDDPRLTTRGVPGGQDPIRVILDGELRTPVRARALPALIFCKPRADARRERALVRAGATVLRVRGALAAMNALAERGIASLLVEGGGETAGSLLEEGLVDRVVMFIAPRIAGGRAAVTAVGGTGVAHMSQAIPLSDVRLRRVGQDVIITGDVHGAGRSQRPRRKSRSQS